MEARTCDGAFWFAMLLRLGRLPIAALRLKSDGASASCTAGEAAARDAQQGDRDGRAPPFSRAVNRNFLHLFPPNCPPWVRSFTRTVRGWRGRVEAIAKGRRKTAERPRRGTRIAEWVRSSSRKTR